MCVTVYISAAPDLNISASVFLFHIFPHFWFDSSERAALMIRASDAPSPDEVQDRCFFDIGVPCQQSHVKPRALKIKAVKVCIYCCPLLTLAVIYGCAPPDVGRQGSRRFWHIMRSFTAVSVASDGQVKNTRIHDTDLHLWTSTSLHDGHEGCITALQTASLIKLRQLRFRSSRDHIGFSI